MSRYEKRQKQRLIGCAALRKWDVSVFIQCLFNEKFSSPEITTQQWWLDHQRTTLSLQYVHPISIFCPRELLGVPFWGALSWSQVYLRASSVYPFTPDSGGQNFPFHHDCQRGKAHNLLRLENEDDAWLSNPKSTPRRDWILPIERDAFLSRHLQSPLGTEGSMGQLLTRVCECKSAKNADEKELMMPHWSS